MSATRGAETPIALDPDGVPIVVDGVLAEDSAAADASESCVICVSRPRAVRFLPCGHASLCQLCTIQEMQRSGQCPVARCSVVQLVAVPVASTDPLSVRRMQTHQDAPEPEGSTFASFAAFLQVMLDSADTEVAQAARAALASQAGANRGQRGFAPQGMHRTTSGVSSSSSWPGPSLPPVTIPEGTTELDALGLLDLASPRGETRAFRGRTSIVNVTFPASLRHIGEQAFLGCTNLALTRLPNGLTSIGNDAFHGCTSLALTRLPDGLTSIGDRAFYGCTSLALTRLPDGLTRLPDGLTSIGDRAFEGCTGISRSSLKKSDGRRLSREEAARIGLPVACECCIL